VTNKQTNKEENQGVKQNFLGKSLSSSNETKSGNRNVIGSNKLKVNGKLVEKRL